MVSKTRLYSILSAALLALGPGQAFAGSVAETEPNHPLSNAQMLPGTASQVQIDGEISRSHGSNDVDFYSFHANVGDVLTFDIDYGYRAGQSSLDTIIAVFDSDGRVLRSNDDAPVDPGSSSRLDSRIENFLVPATGTYTVGVSSYPRYFRNGGSVTSNYVDEGDYQLVIDGLPISVMQISMDIKPGNDDVSPAINPKSNGKIPVALLGSESFDVDDVDVGSLTFGAEGTESSLHKCAKNSKDVNRDGYPDLLCHFYTALSGFDRSSIEGKVKGRTMGSAQGRSSSGGVAFEGSSYLKVVPEKKAAH